MNRMILEQHPRDFKVFLLSFRRQNKILLKNIGSVVQSIFYFIFSIIIFSVSFGGQSNPETSIGVIFSLLLFSIMLSMQSLIKDDYREGVIEQLLLTGVMFESVIIGKILSSVIINSMLYILALPVVMMLLDMNSQSFLILIAAGSLSILGASFITLFCSAISLEANNKVLFSIISLPLLIPIIILGTLSITASYYIWFLIAFDILAFFIFSIATRFIIESIH